MTRLVTSLGYLRLRSPDPQRWREFGRDVIGMEPVETDMGLGFRIDAFPYRLVVTDGDRGLDAAGLQAPDAAAVEEIGRRATEAGSSVEEVSADEAEALGVSGAIRFRDPFGAVLEVFHGPRLEPEPPRRAHVSDFVTGELGAGHYVLGGHDVAAAVGFYRDVLGFEVRNTQRRAGSDAGYPDDRIWFLACNGRHHTVALFEWPEPAELIHFMFEVATIDDVGRALDRAKASGIPQRLSLGRHSNDRMLSFYSLTPDDFTVEIGCDGLVVPLGTPVYETTTGSLWGHERLM